MKIKKLSIRITLCVIIAVAVGMLVQCLLTSYYMQDIMIKEANIKLDGIVNSTSLQMDLYIAKEYAYLDGYMASDEMKALLENPQDAEARAKAEAYTINYTSVVPNAKSVFYTEYDGSVVTHTKEDMIGFKNDPTIIERIHNLYFNNEGTVVYNNVAAVSPATNEIGLIFARSSYSNNKQPAGYSSIELDKTEFYSILENAVDVTPNQDVILTGVINPTVFYSTNPDEITVTSVNPAVLEISDDILNGSQSTEGFITYNQVGTNKPMIGCYRYLEDNDWLLFVGADWGQFKSAANSAIGNIAIVAAIMIAIIAFILAFLIGALIKPLTSVQHALSRVASHNLSTNPDLERLSGRADEIGKLARGTNEVITTLKNAVGLFSDCSKDLNESAENLNDASDLLGEVTSDNKDIADGLSVKINETNESIETIHSEIENIVSMTDLVADKVATGKKQSTELINSAIEMNSKIDAEIDSNMATLQQTMANMQEALESLKAVEQINALSEDIMSIASQTNLLSLNASIEAARAGEAGRGFAVVAGEIGQLADQSKDTAMNITEIVASSNESVKNVREQVSKLIDYIKDEVITSFEHFSSQSKYYDDGISKLKDEVVEIGNAMDSLSESVNEIATQITSVNDASLENTDGVANILGKNEQAGTVSLDIKDLAETSKSNAKHLKEMIDKFILQDK